jgi:hypothetical protein
VHSLRDALGPFDDCRDFGPEELDLTQHIETLIVAARKMVADFELI